MRPRCKFGNNDTCDGIDGLEVGAAAVPAPGRERELLVSMYERLKKYGHAGWCRVFPHNRIGNNSFCYGEAEIKFCDCGWKELEPEIERVLAGATVPPPRRGQ